MEEQDCLPDIGIETSIEKKQDIESLFKNAVEQGLPKRLESKLKGILHKYRNVFRAKLTPDGPAKVDPLKIE